MEFFDYPYGAEDVSAIDEGGMWEEWVDSSLCSSASPQKYQVKQAIRHFLESNSRWTFCFSYYGT